MSTETPRLEDRFVAAIAAEVRSLPDQVRAASALFADGATVPFVARYRKEATGGMDDEQLEILFKRREYFLELQERRDAILESVAAQGKLTEDLDAAFRAASTKRDLEDLYLPFKPKRRTRAQIARERGLEPLADALLAAAAGDDLPEALAAPFVDPAKEVPSAADALSGARDVLAERVSESAENRAHLRAVLSETAVLAVKAVAGKEAEGEGSVYRDYFSHSEPAARAPSHRLLAIFRGEREGVLLAELRIEEEPEIARLARAWGVPLDTPCGRELVTATEDGYKRLLRPSITSEVRAELRARAEAEAIAVFRANLQALLMQSPLGQVPVLGVDPAYRTGCKLAAVDGTGKVIGTAVAQIAPPRKDPEPEKRTVIDLIRAHGIRAVAIGNGTGSREAEAFLRTVAREGGMTELIMAIVPETGASVYSASAVARSELPDLDVARRGAVSIARRMQDPLAELVKIEPRSLGVGQYQHDVDQKALSLELDTAVENVVNRVGVELNSASSALLSRVSGLSSRLAQSVIAFRDTNGPFFSRRDLLRVSGFGPKTFELAAGFLRIRDGEHPLDRTAVHPERYKVVEEMAREQGVALAQVVGNLDLVAQLDFERFRDEAKGLGTFTLEDIREELRRPGRDPRAEFQTPTLREDVQSIEDVKEGMVLEGRISNVTHFGAFVDIGVKRDGLVHTSELSRRWIKDPLEVVQVGQIVRVKVLEVDRVRGRIGLSLKALEPERAPARGGAGRGEGSAREPRRGSRRSNAAAGNGHGEKRARGGHGRKRASAPPPGSAPKRRDAGATTMDDLLKKFAPRH